MEILEALPLVYTDAADVISAVRPDQLGDPTPCEEWDVRALLTHMIGVVDAMAASVAAGSPTRRPDDFVLGDDPAAQFRAAADANLAAWRTPGVLDATVNGGPGPMPGRVLAGINLLDTATHTWDLAMATGHPVAFDDDVMTLALEVSRGIVSPELRAGRFAAEVSVDDRAGATERLVAFLGREPRG